MAIAPGALEAVTMHARIAARYHAQVEILARELRGERGELRARVVKLFRSSGKLRVGDVVTFAIPVHPGRDTPVSPDFDSYHNAVHRDEFTNARYIEAFLNRENGRCRVAADQYAVVAQLSDTPALSVPSEATVKREWARFGHPMPPLEVDRSAIEVQSVVAMRDQDGARSNAPSFFVEWMDEMKAGDSLTFEHTDGGQLVIEGPAQGPFEIRCAADGGSVIATAPRVVRNSTVAIVHSYMRGDEREAVVRAIEAQSKHRRPAQSLPVNLKQLPAARAEFGFRETYSPADFEVIAAGLTPSNMDDKWLIHFDEPWLYAHRRTGVCIYAVRFEESPDGASAVESWANRDTSEYRETNPEYDRALFRFLIEDLILGRETPLPRIDESAQEPHVFDKLVRWWRAGYAKLRAFVAALTTRGPDSPETLLCGFEWRDGVLEIAFAGEHDHRHGNHMVDFIRSILEQEPRPDAVIINLLDYEYEFGNDLAGLYVAFHDERANALRPACIVARGKTLDAVRSLLAEANMIEAFGIRFATDPDDAMRLLKTPPTSRQTS